MLGVVGPSRIEASTTHCIHMDRSTFYSSHCSITIIRSTCLERQLSASCACISRMALEFIIIRELSMLDIIGVCLLYNALSLIQILMSIQISTLLIISQ